MTTIRGPGGVGGPGRTESPGAAPEIDEIDEIGATDAIAATAPATDIDALAAEIAAGRLTAREAVDRLVEIAAGPGLDATERAELRELLNDLVANDPHLGALIGRI